MGNPNPGRARPTDAELAALLCTARQVKKTLPRVTPSPQFRDRLGRRLRHSAQRRLKPDVPPPWPAVETTNPLPGLLWVLALLLLSGIFWLIVRSRWLRYIT